MPGQTACGDAFLEVLQVQQEPAVRVFFQQLGRVLARKHGPQHIHLVVHVTRIRFRQQQIEQGAVAVRVELVTVIVIVELQPLFGQRLASPVEHFGGRAALLFIKRRLVPDPGATDVD